MKRLGFLTQTLYGRQALVLLLLFTAVGGFTVWGALRGARLYFAEVHQQLNREVAEHIVKMKLPMADGEVDQAGLKSLFMDVMTINPSLEVYLLDEGGEILAYDAPEERIVRRRVDLGPVQEFLAGATRGPVLGDDPRGADRRKAFTAHPVEVDGARRGYLYIILGGEQFDSIAALLGGSFVLRLGTWIFLAGLGLSIAVGLLVFRRQTRPLERLRREMEAFVGLEEEAPGRLDEIERLEESYRRMAARIRAQVEALHERDLRRRELLANISHDLRTPTAAVQGYLETVLLHGERLEEPERGNYLAAALRQSERLGKLVEQLFELARLDAPESGPELEPFSPGELAQDVTHKFGPRADEERVALRARFEPDLPPVLADIGLIERALDNLLENALRYTPEGGSVCLSLLVEEDRVTFAVEDTGRGIPEPELPRIFDRFHRVDRARSNRSGGAGLGLAITKRILDLHGSSIQVESQAELGTRFSFDLPVAEVAGVGSPA